MGCGLCVNETAKIINYIGRSGKEYPYGNYTDGRHTHWHPVGTVSYANTVSNGAEELPTDDYPYTIGYRIDKDFLVCREGRCGITK